MNNLYINMCVFDTTDWIELKVNLGNYNINPYTKASHIISWFIETFTDINNNIVWLTAMEPNGEVCLIVKFKNNEDYTLTKLKWL